MEMEKGYYAMCQAFNPTDKPLVIITDDPDHNGRVLPPGSGANISMFVPEGMAHWTKEKPLDSSRNSLWFVLVDKDIYN